MREPGLKQILIDALFPKDVTCWLCAREAPLNAHGLCCRCAEKIRYAQTPAGLRYADGCAAGLLYEPALHPAVYRFKYSGLWYLAEYFADFIQVPGDWGGDVIVPVPLHEARMEQRGYNQSEKLGLYLGERLGVPLRTDLLLRTRDTVTQTGLDHRRRRKNVAAAFCASNCEGLNVFLIDDVRTTGSTLDECARTLKNSGANKVYALSAFVVA